MNANTAKALVLDAFYQVVDNKIFRLLLILEAALVAFFFLISFGEKEVRVLFGLLTIEYRNVAFLLGPNLGPGADLQGLAIQAIQSLVVETLSGSFGMIVCLSATAFFMPNMLEKGAADIVFSRPVSRLTLLLSRYVSGLIFIAILATIGVTGIWLGLLIASGYNDPGVLWGAPLLIFLFGMLHAFSLWIGVLTRSTVASILLSVLFYLSTGGVHMLWQLKELLTHNAGIQASSGESLADADRGAWNVPIAILDGAHLVLPKTADVDLGLQKLRKTVEGEPWLLTDERLKLEIHAPPEALEAPSALVAGGAIDLVGAALAFRAPDGSARVELRARSRLTERPDPTKPGKTRTQRKSAAEAAEELIARMRGEGVASAEQRGERLSMSGLSWVPVRWTAGELQHWAYVATSGDWVLEVEFACGPQWGGSDDDAPSAERQEFLRERFLFGIRPVGLQGPESIATWHLDRFTWDAPLSHNIGFSIASSLAFIVLMLALAWWKLARIDF